MAKPVGRTKILTSKLLAALSAFGGMLGESALERITPFKHFEPNYIIQHGAYDVPLVLISVSVIVISLVGSYVLYTRRDIPAVV